MMLEGETLALGGSLRARHRFATASLTARTPLV
jgi:hypothetical protein